MKKKELLMAMGCMLAMGLLAVCSANAETMYDVAQSGFNNSSGIADPLPLTMSPDPELDGQGGTGLGWTLPWTNYRPGTFSDDSASVQNTRVLEGDQAVLSVGGSGGIGEWSTYGRAFTPQSTGLVLFEFSVQFEADGPYFINPLEIYLADFGAAGDLNPDHYVTTAALFGVGLHGSVQQNKTNTKWGNLTIQPDTWYRIGALVDLDNDTYQVSLDDIEGTLYDGSYDVARPFYSTTGTQVTSFFWANQSPETYLDEFRISSSIPEPSTLVLLCLGVVGLMAGRCRGH